MSGNGGSVVMRQLAAKGASNLAVSKVAHQAKKGVMAAGQRILSQEHDDLSGIEMPDRQTARAAMIEVAASDGQYLGTGSASARRGAVAGRGVHYQQTGTVQGAPRQ